MPSLSTHHEQSSLICTRSAPALPTEHTLLRNYLEWHTEHGRHFENYAALQQWSIADINEFWASIWDYFAYTNHGTPTVAFQGDLMAPVWFDGALVNYTEHALWGLGRTDTTGSGSAADDDVAISAYSQSRPHQQWTYGKLRQEVARVQAVLRHNGVQHGDRVVAIMPNIPEAVVTFLAVAGLGAIWAVCSPETGPAGIVDRFKQLDPKALVTVTGYGFRTGNIDRITVVHDVVAQLGTLQTVVHVPYGQNTAAPKFSNIDTVDWYTQPEAADAVVKLPVAFDHPLCVLFTSGTTGVPKPLIHTHGGFLLEHAKNGGLSWDLQHGKTMYWATTTSWMVWNSLVSALLFQTKIVLADGDLQYPNLDWQWELAAHEGVTLMGISPGYISLCAQQGLTPAKDHDLSKLETIGTSGSPLPSSGYLWVQEEFSDDLIFNIGSGGTDICSAFMQSGPWCSDWVGEMSAPCLGVDVAVYNDDGEPITDEFGELVIRQAMPSMPAGLWGDEDGTTFHASYFDVFDNTWAHGDLTRVRSDTGSFQISGRSDSTLNRGGVRMGTAEFYNVLDSHRHLQDSLIVHADPNTDGRGQLLLFVQDDRTLSLAELEQQLRALLRKELSPRHVPDRVVRLDAIPRTLTGKKVEIPVKRLLEGNLDTTQLPLANYTYPELFQQIIAFGDSLRAHPPQGS